MTGRTDFIRRAWRAAALCGALLAGMPAWAQCRLETLQLPVQLVNQRPVVTIKLNGVAVRMLVDTGGFYSMLTEATATQLALTRQHLPFGFTVRGIGGRIEASRARVKQVELEGMKLSNIEFLVGLNELGSGIGGLLGRNFLSMTDMEFDLAHGVIRMVFPKGDCDKSHRAYWAGDAPVIEAPLEVVRGQSVPPIRVETQINGRRVLAMLDTGAPTTSLERRTALRASVKPEDMTPIGSIGGAGQGRVRAWTALIASFELGGEKIVNNRFMISDNDSSSHDMLLGLDYFLSHRIYVSWAQGRFYATWNGGPVFARRWDEATGNEAHAAEADTVADDDADALARRGRAHAARNDQARALQDLNRAVELAPGNAAHVEARAAVHLAMRAPRPALADLDTALGLDADLHEARMQRVRLRQSLGDAAGSQADLAELDTRLPASSQLRADMAAFHASQRRLPEALQQWAQWIDTHPNDGGMAQVLNARCWLRARLGADLALALDDCQRALRLVTSETSFHNSLGWTQLRLNDAARAVKAFDAAIELQPKSAWSLYGRALALLRQGQPEAAARDLAAARQLRPAIDAEVKRAGFPVPQDLPGGGAP